MVKFVPAVALRKAKRKEKRESKKHKQQERQLIQQQKKTQTPPVKRKTPPKQATPPAPKRRKITPTSHTVAQRTVEHYDDPEAEIRTQLEKKLGIQTGVKLPKEFSEDGLDSLFRGFESDSENSQDEFYPGIQSHDEDDNVDKADADATTDKEEENTNGSHISSTQQVKEKNQEKTVKYIPPALRSKQETSTSSDLVKQIRGLINRLAESTLASIVKELQKLFTSQPQGSSQIRLTSTEFTIICEALSECVLANCLYNEGVTVNHVVLHAAFIAVLNELVGGLLLEQLTTRFKERYDNSEDCTSIVLIYAHLFNFKVLNCELLYDMIKMFIARFNEVDVELLLLLIKRTNPRQHFVYFLDAGRYLRKEDPAALKDVIIEIQKRVNQSTMEGKQLSFREKFMLDTLLALKNNKLEDDDVTSSVANLWKISSQIARSASLGSNELKISWKELASQEKTGRWWLVGSAYSTIVANTARGAERNFLPENAGATSELTILAVKHHMNTDLRRAVFCVLMSSEDYLDAYEKLINLNPHGKEDREISAVVLYCCSKEKLYNPFYSHLAVKLCSSGHNFRFSIQYAFWDKFKEIDTHTPRELCNLAKLLAHLVATSALSLTCLKVVDLEGASLSTRAVLFWREFFVTLLTEYPESSVRAAFERLCSVASGPNESDDDTKHRQSKDSAVRVQQGIMLFYVQALSAYTEMLEGEETQKNQTLLQHRLKMTKKIINACSSSTF